jgi:hypothetical protein
MKAKSAGEFFMCLFGRPGWEPKGDK